MKNNSPAKVCLMVIYNHRFDRNIPRIEAEYSDRFTHVYHIMPFYDGDRRNVIPVYESSFRFQGYIAQAYSRLKGEGFTHYLIVADDMLLNPVINEQSLWSETGLSCEDNFITEFFDLSATPADWVHLHDAAEFNPSPHGVEISRIIPSFEEAKSKLNQYGFHNFKVKYIPEMRTLKNPLRFKVTRTLRYPLAGGYSDIQLLTADVMDGVTTLYGAFAASGLFVELAAPTALLLAVPHDRLKTADDTRLKRGDMWTDADKEFLDEYNHDMSKLKASFPAGKMFLHPIKMSEWK